MSENNDFLLEESLSQQRMSRAMFVRLAGYLRPYRRQVILNLLLTVLATALGLAGPRLIQMGIDRHLTRGVTTGNTGRGILIISLLYLGTLLSSWFVSVAQVKSVVRIGQNAMNDLRLAVFEHIQRLSLNYFDKTHQGRIISRADTDIDALDQMLTWGAYQLLGSALTLVGVMAVMAQYDWRLCLAVCVVLPPLVMATRLFQIHGMEAHRNVRRHSSRITSALAENISGVRVVQALSREDENLLRFGNIHRELIRSVVRSSRIFHTYMPFLGLMAGVGTTIILGYGGTLVQAREITVGELAAFIMYLGMFFGPIQTMGDLYNAMLSTGASVERIFQLLDTVPQVVDRAGAQPLPRIQGRVEFDHVFFRYDTTTLDSWVLRDIRLESKPGETIALVGATGSGKTSIISLLARFYEPQKGCIRMDGRDLFASTIESLHTQIGIVTQENFLFNGTVMDNLKFGRPGAADAEVMEAARMLGTHAIIEGLKDGYQTKVAERGSNFSAGERQLICITRALVAQPRILILDEATSAVDPQAELVIQQALGKLFESRTCFVIAHRLSTIRHAHQILVLKDGEIVERGRHEELLRLNGHYAAMHGEFARHG